MLRLEGTVTLAVQRTKSKSHGDRAFCTATPGVWDKFPIETDTPVSVKMFKSKSVFKEYMILI